MQLAACPSEPTTAARASGKDQPSGFANGPHCGSSSRPSSSNQFHEFTIQRIMRTSPRVGQPTPLRAARSSDRAFARIWFSQRKNPGSRQVATASGHTTKQSFFLVEQRESYLLDQEKGGNQVGGPTFFAADCVSTDEISRRESHSPGFRVRSLTAESGPRAAPACGKMSQGLPRARGDCPSCRSFPHLVQVSPPRPRGLPPSVQYFSVCKVVSPAPAGIAPAKHLEKNLL